LTRILSKDRISRTAVAAAALLAIAAVAVLSGPAKGLAGQDDEPSFCPPLPFVEGAEVLARFKANGKARRTVPYGRRSLIAGRVVDSDGFGLPGEPVCIESRARTPHSPYSVLGTTTTNAEGRWFFKVPSGPSRSFRIDYGGDPDVISTFLHLGVKAHATLHLKTHRTRPHHRVYFSGRIPGPLPGRRVVILRGTIPGAKRKYLIRRDRTDAFGRFRIGYAFSPIATRARFVFWVVVPVQDGYPYRLGRSPKRFVHVRP
jgi:hypothetical protein